MPVRHRWLTRRLTALRDHASRGATLVEYALVTALLVVVSIAALDFLTNTADGEVNNQAECVSDRPPPTGDAGCGFAPVPPDVTFPDPDIVPPTTAPPNPNTDQYAISAGARFEEQVDGWTIVLPVSVNVQVFQDPPIPPGPAQGVRVRSRIQHRDPIDPALNLPDPGFAECVTGPGGGCELRYAVPYPDVTQVTMLLIGVDSPNPPTDLPPMSTFDRPDGW